MEESGLGKMIKAIITDVDGVMVGKEEGVNFPLPHKDVLQVLQKVSESGIPIVLCTGKYGFAIREIAIQAHLNNPHISDGGAIIANPVTHTILKKHVLENDAAKELVKEVLHEGYYVECFGIEEYYVQKNQHSSFTSLRAALLQQEPIIVDSLEQAIDTADLPKINIFISHTEEKSELDKILNRYSGKVSFLWSGHPAHASNDAAVVTRPGVSKASAAKEVAEMLNLSFDEVLGIGDTEGDWRFMKLCKYVAMIGNHDKALQELVKSKEGNFFCASSVDDHGLLETFSHFGIIKS